MRRLFFRMSVELLADMLCLPEDMKIIRVIDDDFGYVHPPELKILVEGDSIEKIDPGCPVPERQLMLRKVDGKTEFAGFE